MGGALDAAKVRAAWELARLVECGPRAAVWALETCDPRTAAAALVTDALVAELERLTEYARVHVAQLGKWALERREAHLARIVPLLPLRASAPTPPADLAAWARERVGVDPDPREAPMRLGRAQPFWCSMFVARAPGEPATLADAAAFAADLFPIGDAWEPMPRDATVESMAYVIGRDLAYRTERIPVVKALGKARGFAGRYGAEATFLASFTADGNSVSSSPVTLHTFSRAFAVVDGTRVGVLAFAGED
jgi:hypothetical protein